MPYPDIKDSKWGEIATAVLYLPDIIALITAPVWIPVGLVFLGVTDKWDAVWLSLAFLGVAACAVALFYPKIREKVKRGDW